MFTVDVKQQYNNNNNLCLRGRRINLDNSRTVCSRCGFGLFGYFCLSASHLLFYSCLWETARYRLKYCFKESLNPKQSPNSKPSFRTNEPFLVLIHSHWRSAPEGKGQIFSWKSVFFPPGKQTETHNFLKCFPFCEDGGGHGDVLVYLTM